MKVKITDKTEPRRAILWERHPSHPGGEIFLVGGREGVYEVGETAEIKRLIKAGILATVAAKKPTPPKITDVSGIGPKTAEKLAGAGINNPLDLAAAEDLEAVAEAAGVSFDQAAEWRDAAEGLLN